LLRHDRPEERLAVPCHQRLQHLHRSLSGIGGCRSLLTRQPPPSCAGRTSREPLY
jgi:hypothetical protein